MLQFLVRRFLYGLLVMFGVITVVFSLFYVLPGDPAISMCPKCSKEQREIIRKSLGLDKPIPVQYAMFLNRLSPLSVHEDSKANQKEYGYTVLFRLGEKNVFVVKWPYLQRSFHTNKKVSEILYETLGGTFWLSITAMTFATIFGVIFGMIAALNQNKFWDHLLVTVSTFGISVPSFVSALVISMVFGFYLSEYTGLNMTGYLWERNNNGEQVLVLKNLILPAFTLGIRPLAIITQLARSSMIEVMSQDYIRTAKAKGLGKFKIIFKHALKNAMNPVVTAVSGWLASLIAGAFFVEKIFAWRGLGRQTIDAVMMTLDLPIIMGVTIVIGFGFIFINILVDIIYAALDPRVRLK